MGEDDYTGRFKFHVDYVANQKPIFFPNINARISFISSNDAAQFLASLVNERKSDVINCASSERLLLSELIRLIAEKTGRTPLLAARAEEGDHSPYGVEGDWFMSTDKLTKQYGFTAEDDHAFLEDLI